jgi:ABC-2 type transport system permease protein
MTRRRTLAVTRRLLAQFRRDRRTIALIFVAPILIMGLFDVLLTGGGEGPRLAVVNQDRGPLGARLSQELSASTRVRAEVADLGNAQRRLKEGSIAAYVLFPEDFSQKAQRDGVISPELDLEGSEPGLSQAAVQALVQAGLKAAGSAGPRFQPRVVYLHGTSNLGAFDFLGAPFIGLVVFFLTFIVTIVSFLRERAQGTLERLMASPLRRSEIVVGYMLAFTALAVVQGTEVLIFSLFALKVYNAGSPWLIFGIVALMALAAVNLGIFLSTFARTEFQAIQFIPLVLVPQILLSGVIVPVGSEPGWLQVVSRALPLTYAVDALRAVMLKGAGLGSRDVLLDLAVVAAFALLMALAAAGTLRRRLA